MLRHRMDRRYGLPALCSALLLILVGCRGDSTPVVEGVIDRETFIEAYVDLRAVTLDAPEPALPDEERDRVLARHGVDAESLVGFVDAYGRELEFMNAVWSEVERRLEARPPASEADAPAR